MLNLHLFQRGVTMAEVLVSVAVIAIAMAIGIPSLANWIQNVQVRSTAESVLTGMQLARAEAVRQNTLAQFMLTGSSAGTASWSIISASSSVPGSFTGQNARLGVSTATVASSSCCTTAIAAGTGMGTNPKPGIVFNAFGKVVTDSSVTKITRVDVTNASYAAARRMVILITDSGMAKLCDSTLPASNSSGCP
jgi:type IV fimbrial biogenesis protein FimT